MLEVGMKVRWIMPDRFGDRLMERAAADGKALKLPKYGDICTLTIVEEVPGLVRELFPVGTALFGSDAVCVAEVDPPGSRFPARFVEPATEEARPAHPRLHPGMRVRCVLDDDLRDKLMALSALVGSNTPPLKMPKRGEVYTITEVHEVPLLLHAIMPETIDELGNVGVYVEEIDDPRRYPAAFFEPVLS